MDEGWSERREIGMEIAYKNITCELPEVMNSEHSNWMTHITWCQQRKANRFLCHGTCFGGFYGHLLWR